MYVLLMFLQASVEVPQYFGVSLLVEGSQIRHPHVTCVKTFIRSHYESLRKSHCVQPHTHPSAKENQCEEEKKTWPPVSTRKVTVERSLTLQSMMEKRCLRLALPSSSGPCPSPSASHLCALQTRSEPSQGHTHRTQRHVLFLNRLEPSLDIISVQPAISYKSYPHQNTHTPTFHVSRPVIHTNQYFSVLQRQNTKIQRNKGQATLNDCRSYFKSSF